VLSELASASAIPALFSSSVQLAPRLAGCLTCLPVLAASPRSANQLAASKLDQHQQARFFKLDLKQAACCRQPPCRAPFNIKKRSVMHASSRPHQQPVASQRKLISCLVPGWQARWLSW